MLGAVVLMTSMSVLRAQTPLVEPVARAGTAVLDAYRAGDLAAIEARFDDNMRRVFPHDKFVATAAQIDAQVGAMQRCAEPDSRVRDGLTVVSYRCDFARAALIVRLAWTDDVRLTGLFFTPAPAPPAAALPLPPGVRDEALVTGAPGWPLPATLLVPTATARPSTRPPIAVLVHGSGPNDRDETIGPNKPFRDLAFGFAAKGIASLRYEKRTRELGARFASELPNWTLDDEIVDDAVAALLQVSKRDDLGPVLVVGHSEGAFLAPRIAASATKRGVRIAGVVMLAAPLTRLDDVIVSQYEFLSRLPVPAATAEMVDDMKAKRDNVRRLVAQGAAGTTDPVQAAAAAGAPLPLGMPVSAWLDIGRYDPATTLLAQPGLPALLFFGGRDFQVPIAEKALWEARLGDRPRTTLVDDPSLNHLLIAGDGPMGPAEYDRAGRVSQALIDRVSAWILGVPR